MFLFSAGLSLGYPSAANGEQIYANVPNRPCRASGYFPGSDGAVREGRGVKFIARRKAVF